MVAQHAPHEGAGLIEGVLGEANIAMTVIRLDLGDTLPELASVDGAVVLGGAMSVRDIDAHPWLIDERHWLVSAITLGLPVLGVCLGAQQMAAALGAAVTTGTVLEVGVGEVTLTVEGRNDRVLGPEGTRLPVVHWHGDTFDLPEGAVPLASSARYTNQAFRIGSCAYALQFHLEVDEQMASAWAPHLPPGVCLEPTALEGIGSVGRRVFGRFVDTALNGQGAEGA